MQTEFLKIFCDVVRLHSFSEGGRENHVTQSSASQAVQQIEDTLGIVLIDRSHRPWELTPEGRFFYEGCRKLLENYQTLVQEVKHVHDETRATIRVAAIYSVGLAHMKQYSREFGTRYPNTRVHLEYLHPDRVYESVRDENADIGIVSFPRASREITVIPWHFEPMVVACHPSHPFARKAAVALDHLRNEKFVGFDKDLVIRKEIEKFLRKHDAAVNVIMEFDNIEAIKRAVEIASGISILPRPTMEREVKTKTLVAVPLETKELVRPLGIIHRHGKKFHANVLRFIELLRNESNEEPLENRSRTSKSNNGYHKPLLAVPSRI